MSDKLEISLLDGKYTYIFDYKTGKGECLRYGETWRGLVGDGMVLAMAQRIEELEEAVKLVTPDVIDLVRCGIGGNYGGEAYYHKIEKTFDPIKEKFGEINNE